MIKITELKIISLESFIQDKNVPQNEIHLVWLGQAGFAFKFNRKLLIIDPYLSDYLSKKNKGKLFPHIRLMDVPIYPENIKNIDYILSSHAHSDHMDPETLSVLSVNNPNCRIIAPAAEVQEAINRGAKKEQIIPVNDGQIIELENDIRIIGVAASHETLKINEKGEYHFLGYIFDFGGIKIYHSGDCIPYDGLYNKLKKLYINIALLPINGRDNYRLNNGIAGNFLIREALELCRECEIKTLIVHHFGMFAYNTATNEELEELKKKSSKNRQIIIPKINVVHKIKR